MNLVDKWTPTGLLIKCKNVTEKTQLANILEDVATYLMSEKNIVNFEIKISILPPLVTRIYYKDLHNIDIEKVYELVDKLYPKYSDINAIPGIDAESEFTALCADTYEKENRDIVFTGEQIRILKLYQSNENLHPYTCCNHVAMKPEPFGLRCPICGRIQTHVNSGSLNEKIATYNPYE